MPEDFHLGRLEDHQEQVNRIAQRILFEDSMKPAGQIPVKPAEQERSLSVPAPDKPFLADNYLSVIPGMACLSTSMLNGGLAGGVLTRSNHFLGSTLVTMAGMRQGHKDYDRFQISTGLDSGKYGAALAADLGMVSGGVLGITRLGPKWLAPSLMLGSIVTRAMLDLIPSKR